MPSCPCRRSGGMMTPATIVSLFGPSARVGAFGPSAPRSGSPLCGLTMSSGGGFLDAANFALGHSPATTKFVTNRMCPFAQKVWIALEVIGAPYEMEEVALYGPNGKPDWFWDLNPEGTVPVLVCYGGAVVYPDSDLALDQIESGAAVETGGFQFDSTDQFLKRKIQAWRDSIEKMLPIGREAVQGGNKQQLLNVLKEMDGKVVGPYLCGEEVTSADCAAFPFLWRLESEFGLSDYKNLNAWLKTCNNNMAFSKTVQSTWWWWW